MMVSRKSRCICEIDDNDEFCVHKEKPRTTEEHDGRWEIWELRNLYKLNLCSGESQQTREFLNETNKVNENRPEQFRLSRIN